MIKRSVFTHTADGLVSDLYTLENKNGFRVDVTPFACRVVSIFAKDRDGRFGDVLLGYEDPNDYVDRFVSFYGVTLGRYANRIAGAQLHIDGETFDLPQNEGRNCTHGGVIGFHRLLWDFESAADGDEPTITFTHFSPDGDQGFPGNLTAKVRFTVLKEDTLRIEFFAETDHTTPVNLSSHGYFNLSADLRRNVLDTVLQINADNYTPVNDEHIPTGEIRSVAGTPFDFRAPKPIGRDIRADEPSMLRAHGYDHNLCVNGEGFRQVAVAHEPVTGRVMEVWSDRPGVQLYTCNTYDDDLRFKGGVGPLAQQALCLEPEYYPDSPNHANFPFAMLKPGEKYASKFEYKFYAR